ncbi:Putative penicillin-binding protein [Streptomyces venezuelae]|uniref:penicillin-binding transpeptidase domain-containing protein n=1 Tax=Streptomyces gardneri TaxID=66892 RepID=UPI0006BCBB2D|nr:penicillin-binding transpeptidase domain-containing protein [Streptomyces gardneri]ALO08974.1 Putative penicillin-binding protein [Streptomyces venezuelae]QPK46129.1 penicillin-binding protein [Streptomyces gardneri]WRK37496.1 penicillin-binding transpeptidase domain-containing protein [Streptomyces venezuelae]CUM40635.1 Cell division protein FtsI [Peptidoglycan synthetase] [Streptomyces venezuelae]
MRSGAKTAIVGGVFLVVAGGVGYGGLNLYNGITGGNTSPETRAGDGPRTGPVTGDEVTSTAREFLAAWAAGEPEKAGQLTNDPVTAGPAVAAYRDGASVSEATITPGTPVGAKVPFTVKATITYKDVSKPWSYTSELTVVRGQTTGRPLVKWAPSVLHPKLLTADATVRTGVAKAASVKAVDRNGRELTAEKYPSLAPVLAELRKRYGAKAGGSAGIETWIDSGTESGTDIPLLVLSKGKEGTLKTTIDAGVQAAAEKAVKTYGKASVAAIEPSTGAIRAVANNPATEFNTALQGQQAPGSTMKIVTATMMLQNGVVAGPGSKVECPPDVLSRGQTFENLDRFSIPNATLAAAFRRSCNTAFIKAITVLSDKKIADTALGDTARDSFGIGQSWQVGVPAADGSVPESAGNETSASYIGQGRIQMSALNVASLSATVKNGGFLQPYLVAKELDDREFAEAEPLSRGVTAALQKMMNETATASDGTAVRAMSGVPFPKGAKTGSAEVGGQDKSNSWFTGYSGDLAAAAVVQSGGHGSDAAGPVVANVLKAG